MPHESTAAAPPAQTIVRILALVFGLLGGISAAWQGYRWSAEMNTPEYQQDLAKAVHDSEVSEGQLFSENQKELIASHQRRSWGRFLMMGTLPLGILVGVLAYLRIVPLVDAALMLVAFVLPAIIELEAILYTIPFAVGAFFAMRIAAKTTRG